MIRPLNGFVMVKLDAEINATASGLVLPQGYDHSRSVQFGVVVETDYDETQIRVGDHVFFARTNGTGIEINGENFITIHGDDILGIKVPA